MPDPVADLIATKRLSIAGLRRRAAVKDRKLVSAAERRRLLAWVEKEKTELAALVSVQKQLLALPPLHNNI